MEARKAMTAAVLAVVFTAVFLFSAFATNPAEGCVFYIVDCPAEPLSELHTVPQELASLPQIQAADVFRIKQVSHTELSEAQRNITITLDGITLLNTTLTLSEYRDNLYFYYSDYILFVDNAEGVNFPGTIVVVNNASLLGENIIITNGNGQSMSLPLKKGTWANPNYFVAPLNDYDNPTAYLTYEGVKIYTNESIATLDTPAICYGDANGSSSYVEVAEDHDTVTQNLCTVHTLDIKINKGAPLGTYCLVYGSGENQVVLENAIRVVDYYSATCQSLFGDSIVKRTGEFLYNHTDVSIHGKNLDFNLTRAYKSKIEVNGIAGYNWDHSFNQRLFQNEGIVTYWNGAHQGILFVQTGEDVFFAPDAFGATLSREDTDHYKVESSSGLNYIFYDFDYSPACLRGKLHKITDHYGNEMTCEYYDEQSNFPGMLYRVTLDNGLEVTFDDYDLVGGVYRLAEVTYPVGDDLDGGKVIYHYDANANLETVQFGVTNPSYIHYKYTSGFSEENGPNPLNHNITDISNPTDLSDPEDEGVVYYVHNYYKTNPDRDEVDYQTRDGSYSDRVFTDNINDGCDPANLNVARQRIVYVNRKGYVTYSELNVEGKVILERRYKGSVTLGTNDDTVDEVLSLADAAESERGETGYYETRQIACKCGATKESKKPNGNVTENVYFYDTANGVDADPRVKLNLIQSASRSTEGTPDSDSIIEKKGYVQFFKEIGGSGVALEYDGDGKMYGYELVYNKIKAVSDPRCPDETVNSADGSEPSYGDHVTVYYYDFEEVVNSVDYNGDSDHTQQYGNQIRVDYPEVTVGKYAGQANYVKSVYQTYYDTTGQISGSDYSLEGRQRESRTQIGATTVSRTETIYDVNGRPYKTRRYYDATNYLASQTFYYADGKTKYTQDERGIITYYEYDAMGRAEYVKYNSNSTGSAYGYKTRNYYDAGGSLSQVLQYDSADNVVALKISEYDILGHQTDQWVCNAVPAEYDPSDSGDVDDAKAASVHTSYAYDANENPVETTVGTTVGGLQKTGTVYDERDMVWKQQVAGYNGSDYVFVDKMYSFYDGNGNLVKQIDGRYPYDPENPNANDGYAVTYLYDGFDRKVVTVSPQYTEGASNYYAVSYTKLDKAGLATYQQVAKNDTRPGTINSAKALAPISKTSYLYDELNRRCQTTVKDLDDENDAVTYSYANIIDDDNVKSVVSDPTDLESYTLTDWLGRTVKSVDPAGNYAENTYSYDGDTHRGGSLIMVRTHDGGSDYYVHNLYDSAGRLSKTANSGASSTINWESINSSFLVTDYTYDDLGRTVVVSDPKGIQTKTFYDGAGRVTDTERYIGSGAPSWDSPHTPGSDADYVTTHFAYDDKGQQRYVQDDKGSITYYRTELAYASSAFTQTQCVLYGSNEAGTSYSNGAKTVLNQVGQAITTSVIDSSGDAVRTVTREYDARGMVVKEYLSTGTLPGMQGKTFEYDALGRPTVAATYMTNNGGTLSDPKTRVTRAYNSLGLLTAETQAVDLSGDGTFGETGHEDEIRIVAYSDYDLAGRLGRITYPSGRVIELNRNDGNDDDPLLRVRRMRDVTATPYNVAEYTYTGASRVHTRTYDQTTDTQLAVTYDGFGRVTDFDNLSDPTGTPVSFARFGYAYDKANNRTSEQYDFTANSEKWNVFAYDKQNQITQVKYAATASDGAGAARTTDFTLDTVNNRTAVADTLGSGANDVAHTLNGLHQYTQVQFDPSGTPITLTRSHDDAGNLADDGAAEKFLWDYNDRLSEITDRAETPDTIATYIYDALGRRALKTVGTAKTRYIYNGPDSPSLKDGWQAIEEYEGTSALSLTRTCVYGNNIDEVLQVKIGNDTYYYHTNVQGNTVAVSDATGAVVEKVAYDVYGRITKFEYWDTDHFEEADTTNGFVTPTEYYSCSLTKNTILFQGRNLDPESGLYYFRNRQYDPVHGRFLSRDPAGYHDSYSLYQFVNNNPVCYVDSTGRWVDPAMAVTWDDGKVILASIIEAYRVQQGKGSVDDLGLWETMKYIYEGPHTVKGEFRGRYIWTQGRGFLDLKHFFEAAVLTDKVYYTGFMVLEMGEHREEWDVFHNPGSAFGFEDLPSNAAGVEFEAFLPDKVSGLVGALNNFINGHCGGGGALPGNINDFNPIYNFSYTGLLDPNGASVGVACDTDIRFVSSGNPLKDGEWVAMILGAEAAGIAHRK